jgi:hypothetical protein
MFSTYDDQMSDEAMREVEREWYGDDEPWADPREWYIDQPTILLSAMRVNDSTGCDQHQLCEDCLSDPHCRLCADHSAHWYHVDAMYGHEE